MQRTVQVDAIVEDAVARVRAGEPTVLDIEGNAGFGKTHLARRVAERFPAERLLRATAYEDTQNDPLSLLEQLGVDTTGVRSNALQASQALGARIDSLHGEGPIAVVVDDLHWADPESIDALGVLMERMAGDRVLVIAGHRPVGSRHARWETRLNHIPSVLRVVLDGLDDAATLQLLGESAGGATAQLAAELREHTGGSPLFLRSLLHEHTLEDLQALATRNELPAPRDLVATMGERVSRLDPAAVATLSAIAVIGSDGADRLTVSAVADVPDIANALDLLAQDRLVVVDGTGPTARARIFHGVIQAAVYNNIPRATRERMHAVAAARLGSVGERLRHRVAAVRGADDGLAVDLTAFADALHERARYREAARLRRQAAQFSSAPAVAAAHVLEADLESVLALDFEELSVHEQDVAMDASTRYVIGAKLAAEKRFVAASDMLSGVTDEELASFTPLNAYRARVFRAWSLVAAGRSPQLALHDLAVAQSGPSADPALRGYAAMAQGQAAQRAAPVEERMSIAGLLSHDRAQMAATPEGTAGLAWRGAVMSLTGMPKEAIGDLGLITSRFGDGMTDFSDGMFHGLLGFAYFVNGQWPRAAMMIGLSRAGRLRRAAPLVASIEPLMSVVSGDAVSARVSLAEARRIRIDGPQPAAVHAGDIVDVLTLFFVGRDGERAGWLEGRIQDLGSPDVWADEQVPHLWYVAQAIGAQWAGRLDAVPRWAGLLRTMDPPPWSADAAEWLEARADRSPQSTRRLLELADRGLPQLPALNALLQFDAAHRAPSDAERSVRSQAAASVLRDLGADVLAAQLPETSALVPRSAEQSILAELSDREREVAALILEGLSYSQAAKELFITRSTVSFHLSRIYAKTGTNSRHELIQAARQKAR